MNLCQTCWDSRGRSLAVGCCLCTGDALKPSEFHQWSAGNRVDYTLPREKEVEATVVEHKIKLEFGKRPETKVKKSRRKRV